MVEKQQIILRHRNGDSNRKIATDLNIDKNTVNKYVREYEEEVQSLMELNPEADEKLLPPGIMEQPHYDTSSRDLSDMSKRAIPIIRECLEENARKRETGRSKHQQTKKDIHSYLVKKKGIHISYSTVKRLIREIEEEAQEAFIRQEHLPGQETEFDWGEVKLDIGDSGYKKYQMAAFASAYGNHRFAQVYRTQDTAAFQESHTVYFAFCGGVYHTVVYDNMRVAVKQFVGKSEKEPTTALLQMSAYYGFQYRFCNVRRGNEKGHVERTVDVMRRFAFSEPGKDKFDSLEEANQYLLRKCIEKNAEALSDGRIPEETFLEEKPYLMPALPKMPCFMKKNRLRVDKYSTVAVNNVHYSVPDRLVGKRVNAKIFTSIIEIHYRDECVASHERHYQQGEYVLDIYHYLHTLKKKPGAIPQSTALLQADTTVKNIYETYYTDCPKEFPPVLELIADIGAEAVQTTLAALTKRSVKDLSAMKLRLVHDRLTEMDNIKSMEYGQDRLSLKSKSTLVQYDLLRELQNGRAC